MTQRTPDDLWRDFPKTATEFEKRFATEEDCRAYWIEARWGGKPACARCGSTYVWPIRSGTTFECHDCDHQTSLTSGTVLEKTRKPLNKNCELLWELITGRKKPGRARDCFNLPEVRARPDPLALFGDRVVSRARRVNRAPPPTQFQ